MNPVSRATQTAQASDGRLAEVRIWTAALPPTFIRQGGEMASGAAEFLEDV